MQIALSGSSGLVGQILLPRLREAGHEVRPLVRRAAHAPEEIAWQPDRGQIDAAGLGRCDAVIHLAGANLAAGRWTQSRKELIRSSRVESTRLLATALANLPTGPKILIAASAVGFYGDRGEEVLDESSGRGAGFLAEVCAKWEDAASAARAAGVRVVHLRLGVVVAPGGGVVGKMRPAFQWGGGAVIGDGSNWLSWIGGDDLGHIVLRALGDAALNGPVNAVAPHPVRSGDFARELGRQLHRPVWLRVPGFGAQLVFGEMAKETLLASQRAEPAVLRQAGFEFRQAELPETLRRAL